ncbi:plasmolipin-like [Centruroides sculpturatus]|uniref:plasmolipin-like n=1 Tax=Centruroides sculpturatus TaxID=218467 RepID=UPI000C6CDF33|nr:plasmolipin-like [Centruroides sculpturatus]
MSHTVTVRTTTTTASTSAIIVNTGFIRTWNGILKLFETIIGAVILGLIGYYGTHYQRSSYTGFYGGSEETLMFLVSFGFLLTTFVLLLTSMCSLMTSSVLPKTLFEFVYHVFAFIFYLSAGLALLIVVSRRNDSRYYRKEYGYEGKMAAAVLGLINAALYFLSAFFSFRAYRVG